MQYQCGLCSYRDDETRGDPLHGIPAGTPWSELPEGWCCPECGVSGGEFSEVTAESMDGGLWWSPL